MNSLVNFEINYLEEQSNPYDNYIISTSYFTSDIPQSNCAKRLNELLSHNPNTCQICTQKNELQLLVARLYLESLDIQDSKQLWYYRNKLRREYKRTYR